MHPAELQVERTGRQRRAIIEHRAGLPFTNTLAAKEGDLRDRREL